MSGRFAQRVAVVTGAASGVGRASALRFAAEGASVVLIDVDTEGAGSAVGEISARGGAAVAVCGDVSDERAWDRVRETAHNRFGPVHTLHCNAFRHVIGEPRTVSLADFRAVLNVNVGGMFLGARAFADDLESTGGSIVATSSVHAMIGIRDYSAYAASKGAIVALTRQLAVQYAPAVRVNCVLPGPVDTPALKGTDEERARAARATALGRLGRADEIAAAVAFLAGPDASFVTGAALVVDGGWSTSKDSI